MYSSDCYYCPSQAIKFVNTIVIGKQHLSQKKTWCRENKLNQPLFNLFSPPASLQTSLSSVTIKSDRVAFYIERYMFKKLFARYVCWRGSWQWCGIDAGEELTWAIDKVYSQPCSVGRDSVGCDSVGSVQLRSTHSEKLAAGWNGAQFSTQVSGIKHFCRVWFLLHICCLPIGPIFSVSFRKYFFKWSEQSTAASMELFAGGTWVFSLSDGFFYSFFFSPDK